MPTDLVFLGAMVLDGAEERSEYVEVLVRLVEGPALSASSGSGATRFLPFKSEIGSFIASAVEELCRVLLI